MKIVYFGTDVFLSCFEFLLERHEILALYTYHNEEDYFTEYAVARRARALGISVHYEEITPQEIRRYFEEEGCELFFIAEYNRILRLPEGLERFRGINTHSSLLPEGRSYYPIEAAMAQGLRRTGVTMHKITPVLDSGDILAQRSFEIAPEMDSVDVYLRCAAHAKEMLEEILLDFDGAWAKARKQTGRMPYWKRPAPEGLTLLHGMTRAQALAVFRRANGMTQVELGGRWYYVSALMTGAEPLPQQEQPVSGGRWLYRVADGHLRLSVHPIPERRA